MMTPRSLASFPEELLLRILALALALEHPSNSTALLFVSRQFLRIASPLFYHTLHLHSPRQAARVRDTLSCYPALASAVRHIVFAGICNASAGVLALCDRVCDIDICLEVGPCHRTSLPFSDPDVEAFCDALERRHTLARLTIRKDPAVYLTHPQPVYVFQRLAQAVRHWPNLETVHFALRASASPTTLLFAHALSVAPRLRSIRAQLPAVWNNLLLIVSMNPRLEKVMLYSEPIMGPLNNRPNSSMGLTVIKAGHICDGIEHAVFSTGLYMMEARKHARLSELIKCGTAIIRTRAHTTIASVSTPSSGGTPLGAIRAKEVAIGLMADANRDSFGSAVHPFALTDNLRTHSRAA